MKHLLLSLFAAAALFAQSDVTPPVLRSLSLSTDSLDTTLSDATLTVTARITDDLAGFTTSFNPALQSNSSSHRLNCRWVLQSGTPQDGIYTCRFTVPRYSAAGLWFFTIFFLNDTLGNSRSYLTPELTAAGFPNSVTVTSFPDLAAPEVTALSFSPSTVNVGAGDQTITVELGLRDWLSGLSFPDLRSFDLFALTSPSGKQQRHVPSYSNWSLVSGTAQDGVWRASFVMPKDSESGLWTLERATFRDRVTNAVNFSSASLSGPAFTSSFTVISPNQDVTPPTLLNYSISPTFVNSAIGNQIVYVQMNVKDDRSGNSFGPTYPGSISRSYSAIFTSPSGQQSTSTIVFNGSAYAELIAGNALSGVWRGQSLFLQFSEAGTWRLTSLRLRDGVVNETILRLPELQALGLPTTVEVIRPTGGVDGAVGSAGGTVQDQTFGARAQIIAPPGVLPATTQVSIEVLQNAVNVPTPQGFSTAESPFVNIDFAPHPQGLLPAPGLSLTIPLRTSATPGTILTLLRINPATGTLVPATSVTGGLVTGAVTADGINVTFNGIATLSTVVAMRAAVPGDVNSDGVVNCADVAIVKASYNKRTGQPGFDVRADVTGDGIVNLNDLAYVTRRLPVGLVCP